ncbi:SpoIID/LytB domain-containing protein [Spirulina subsalsa FACHB-351]|uniref:SpoIID/LytB domain-containing protein n=1 Tax=Spirulina subsalsa FACHB-351 TaxID=234711 RepID=A0ABT3L055_9CYAN|nr:SpoIID/LytB domain-containing protein [Spirulina subsalsa]MCW6034883.1 SpoIID/LytB domain-containing protein [Spirulina subsalsa FACHB-351]
MFKTSLLILLPLSLLSVNPSLAQATVTIDVGIVQRFGEEDSDRLTLSGSDNTPLTLEFLAGDGSTQTVTTPSVTLEIVRQPQENPLVREWVVLSDHATFETAENSAKAWQEKGIEVEVTQPGRWQVWAKRDVYNTPLLRRMLIQNLQEAGESEIYLQSEVLETTPVVSFVVGNFRYNRANFAIRSANNRIRVNDGTNQYVYAGDLRIQPNAYGDFTLVNNIDIETYLRGVVPHEIGPNAPYNAVEAQAIIARTYALRNLRRFKADNYELCATVHCQVYRGLTGTVERSDRAITATAGLVLTYNNELVDALYSAHSGGTTSPFEDTWDGEPRPYLQAQVDAVTPPWDLTARPLNNEQAFREFMSLQTGLNGSNSSVFRWSRESSIEELTADLNRYLERTKHPLAGINRILSMEVAERSVAGRILRFVVETDKGTVELHKTEARSAFGPPRSTLFYVDPIRDGNQNLTGYRFVGGGFGHGVGLSQYSSYTLANLGWNATRILEFYYPGAKVEPLNDSLVFYPED